MGLCYLRYSTPFWHSVMGGEIFWEEGNLWMSVFAFGLRVRSNNHRVDYRFDSIVTNMECLYALNILSLMKVAFEALLRPS